MGRRRPASTAHERARHGADCMSTREEAAQIDRWRQLRGTGGKQRGGARLIFNFEVFTELPLH